tara:strand:+ start:1431 stop:1664 length:234 start_codon:yes stop_codon:yes gene_type:complete
MSTVKYIKEFAYIVSGITALFACACGGITLLLAPFGLAIYISDVLGYHDVVGFVVIIMTYCFYWVTARHFNWIEGVR